MNLQSPLRHRSGSDAYQGSPTRRRQAINHRPKNLYLVPAIHDMADNIIHLVLAKFDGGPEAHQGRSLFIVPKFMVKEDGSLGTGNAVSVGFHREKMGIHGNSTCCDEL